MDYMVEWIRQLIVIVIIASFIQLLIPGRSFSRYVRVVMGFFIILTLLQPLIRVFQLTPVEGELPWPQTESGSFSQLEEQGERIKERGEGNLLSHLQQKTGQEIESLLLQAGYPVVGVELSTDHREELEEIRIGLQEEGASEAIRVSLREENDKRAIEEELEEYLIHRLGLLSCRIIIHWH